MGETGMSWSAKRASRPQNKPRTHCYKAGHLITGIRPDGVRYCVQCKQATDRRVYEKLRREMGKPAKPKAPGKYVRSEPSDRDLDSIALQGWRPKWGVRKESNV
jgi:hypothetical protein